MISKDDFLIIQKFSNDLMTSSLTVDNYNEQFFSVAEIFACRTSLKTHVGSMGINNDMIRKFPLCKLDKGLQLLINTYFFFVYWPISWRSCIIHPLKKPGSSDFQYLRIIDLYPIVTH